MKTEIRTLNYYNGISKGYKDLYHNEQIKKIETIKKYLPKTGIILDIGSGDGVLNQFLNKDLNLISVDLSHNLLKLNDNKLKIQASVLNLPFKNETIEFISSFTMIQDVPNPKKAIIELKRILKPNGTMILSFIHYSKDIKILKEEIVQNFKIIKEIKEEKDYIYVLKK